MTTLNAPASAPNRGGTAASSAEPRTNAFTAFMDKHHFILRRLHSLSGIFPVGLFIIAHLFTNAQMAWNDAGDTFQHEVNFIHSIPALVFIEISLWVGIGFHALLGLYYTFSGRSNVRAYSYSANWRYTLQRISGIVALVFIFFHIATLRWRWDILGWYTPFYASAYDAPGLAEAGWSPAIADAVINAPMSGPLTAYALQFSTWVALLYLVGTLFTIYHWSNGLWTAAITWGVTTSAAAMKRWGYACLGLFVALFFFFAAAFWGSLVYDFDELRPEQKVAFMAIVEDGGWVFDEPIPDEAALAAHLAENPVAAH